MRSKFKKKKQDNDKKKQDNDKKKNKTMIDGFIDGGFSYE